jgi:coenzyme F420-reducing hydrogenase beta subunit
LVEISVVSTPANANAVFTISKSLKKLFDEVEKEADTEQNEEEAVADEVIEVETIEDKTEDEKTAEIEENDAEEKACSKKPKKMKLKKDYFEEKRVLLA